MYKALVSLAVVVTVVNGTMADAEFEEQMKKAIVQRVTETTGLSLEQLSNVKDEEREKYMGLAARLMDRGAYDSNVVVIPADKSSRNNITFIIPKELSTATVEQVSLSFHARPAINQNFEGANPKIDIEVSQLKTDGRLLPISAIAVDVPVKYEEISMSLDPIEMKRVMNVNKKSVNMDLSLTWNREDLVVRPGDEDYARREIRLSFTIRKELNEQRRIKREVNDKYKETRREGAGLLGRLFSEIAVRCADFDRLNGINFKCCLYPLNVKLSEFMPNIISPTILAAHSCRGECDVHHFPITTDNSTEVWTYGWNKYLPGAKPCCAPRRYEGVNIVYMTKDGSNMDVRSVFVPNLLTVDCSCS